MIGSCATAAPEAWVYNLIAVVDCKSDLLGAEGWQGLSSSNLFATILTCVLTLAIARLGYRMMFGQLGQDEILRLVLHIGIVIALATSWQAYDRLIYRVAMNGPSEIAAEIFPAAGINTSRLAVRLQNAYDVIAPAAKPSISTVAPTRTAANGPQIVGTPPAQENTSIEAQPSAERKTAANVMVIAGAGSWIAARLTLALLLALGPFAFAASLFPATAGLFIGWLRGILGATLATLVIPLAIALQLQILEPPVRAAVKAGASEIAGLEAIVWSFALVILALILGVQRLADGLTLRNLPILRQHLGQTSGALSTAAANAVTYGSVRSTRELSASSVSSAPSRALGIVRAVETRERTLGRFTPNNMPATRTQPLADLRTHQTTPRGAQLVDGVRRTTASRNRPSAQRPDSNS